MPDPYAVLGVSRSAGIETIKAAYRSAAKRLHPDAGQAGSVEAFRALNEAYRDLLARHNQATREQAKHSTKAQSSDVFDDYGDHFRPFRRRGAQQDKPRSGGDTDWRKVFRQQQSWQQTGTADEWSLTVELNFVEAMRGARLPLTTPDERRLTVTVPAGVSHGQTLRLKGQGPVKGFGAAGDLLVRVLVQPDSTWRREGEDILRDTPLPLWLAVLGGDLPTETIHGPANLTIPAGASSGQILRLQGQGVRRDDGKTGDHVARLDIALPQPFDADQHSLLRSWARLQRDAAAGGSKSA